MSMEFRGLTLSGILFASILTCGTASAQDVYPNKPVRLIVPYAAGGPTDNYARLFGQRMSDILGQQFVVENRVGAGGSIGVVTVAKSPNDGYTLLFGAGSSFSTVPFLQKDAGYKREDLTPISMILRGPFTLTVRTTFPAQTLPGIIDYAKKNPSKVTIGSVGIGSGPYLLGRLLQSSAGIKLVEVPFKGVAPLALEMKADRIDLVAEGSSSAIENERNNVAKIVVVADTQRSPLFPDVPSTTELGYPDMILSNYFVLFAPAGTPKPVLDKLHAALSKVVASEEFKQSALKQGSIAQSSTPEYVNELITSEARRIKKVIDEAGIQPQ